MSRREYTLCQDKQAADAAARCVILLEGGQMNWQGLKEALTEMFHYFSLGSLYREDLELRPVQLEIRGEVNRRPS